MIDFNGLLNKACRIVTKKEQEKEEKCRVEIESFRLQFLYLTTSTPATSTLCSGRNVDKILCINTLKPMSFDACDV